MAEYGVGHSKTSEEGGKMFPSAIPRQRMCLSSLLNAGVESGNFKHHCQFRAEVYSMVESEIKNEVATN